jgi:hypothetical protein
VAEDDPLPHALRANHRRLPLQATTPHVRNDRASAAPADPDAKARMVRSLEA